MCSNIMVQIKGQQATSLTFSFLKLITIESHFRDKDYFNTFILPNTNPNMFKYYGTNQGTTSDISKLLISQTCKHRGQNLNFAPRVISFYRIYNQICSNIRFRINGHRGTSSTFIFIKLVTI